MTRIRPNYGEILRLGAMGLPQQDIAVSVGASKKTVNKILRLAKERGIEWCSDPPVTNDQLAEQLFNKPQQLRVSSTRQLPDLSYIHKELMRKGVNRKLLWREYVERCRLGNVEPLMYSQFCFYIQQDEERRRATMRIHHKPAERIEVDWAGDPACIIDPVTGETVKAWLFVGTLPYSQYTFVEAFTDQKQKAWLQAHVDMYRYFGGVSKILVPDNCKTAVVRNNNWYTPKLNTSYHELAAHYGTAIIPARVRTPKDKPSAEGNVRHVSTWITAALRNQQCFSLSELNESIAEKLEAYNHRKFQKRDGSPYKVFIEEEQPYLLSLPAFPFELAEWRTATVQYNYHISVDRMMYSVPYEYIHKQVDVRLTDNIVEVYYDGNRIASHARLRGGRGKYSTLKEHMPENHQAYLEWDSNRFRKWASSIGRNVSGVVEAILSAHSVEQQGYRSCMALLKLAEKYGADTLDSTCKTALSLSPHPSYQAIKNLLASAPPAPKDPKKKPAGLTRGASYFGRRKN